MAHVAKCDSCGQLDDASNTVETMRSDILIAAPGLTIRVDLPVKFRDTHLCRRCVHGVVSARFAELCGLLAPYQPARVAGFIQDGPIDEDQPLTKAERNALSILSRRLLKA